MPKQNSFLPCSRNLVLMEFSSCTKYVCAPCFVLFFYPLIFFSMRGACPSHVYLVISLLRNNLITTMCTLIGELKRVTLFVFLLLLLLFFAFFLFFKQQLCYLSLHNVWDLLPFSSSKQLVVVVLAGLCTRRNPIPYLPWIDSLSVVYWTTWCKWVYYYNR